MQILANGQAHEVGENRFTLLIHQQGIRVDVPEAVEINSRNTIDCMEKMSQKQWEWISTGELFRELYGTIFPTEDYGGPKQEWVEPDVSKDTFTQPKLTETGLPLPISIEELNKSDFGIVHACGMIVLGCEAIFGGKRKLFFRTPEDHLHPKAERRIVQMLKKMMYLAGTDGTVTEDK